MYKAIVSTLVLGLCLSIQIQAAHSPIQAIQTQLILNSITPAAPKNLKKKPKKSKEVVAEPVVEWTEDELSTIDRPEFSLKYPKGWKIAENEPRYNIDSYFTINTGGNSYITIEILKGADFSQSDKLMKNVLFALDGPAIDTRSRSSFKEWGHFKGKGKHLKGKILHFDPGGIRVFTAAHAGHVVLITEFYYSSELKKTLPGFDIISQTFNFKEV